MATTSANTFQRRENVTGYEHRRNDLLYFPNHSSETSTQRLVYYFGGDIQDWPERMQSSRENRRYARWNLVSTGEMLCRRFVGASVVVIRPREMKDGIFSRFANFLPNINDYGDPITYETTDLLALRQLRALTESINDAEEITLVGFSKGCVVLNQLLHELTALRLTKTSEDLTNFVSRLRTFVWLDGGHNNGERTMVWPTDSQLVSTLEHFGIRTEVFVTPFQINANNPHKRQHYEDYQKFSKLLLEQSKDVVNRMFFSSQPPSIDKHFELLSVF